MAESLFDNRYRYDYIYPRGRSGETLRATDTQDNDRPVVIKRPAPHDAPPIRFGQEVSIQNERKALSRLTGHAAIPELLGGGQFFVSGIAHQYISMERAEGQIIADLVLDLASRGERLPELEMLNLIDMLLDVLHAAHGHDIVYNDVDAKHLFWDRDRYRLKVIDWGNAVFLEGDEITAQGVSRQSDIYQVGELLYFILTGGSRMETPRDAGDDFKLDFGHDSERVLPRLQAIVSKAAHPNLKLRYRSISDLRKDLADFRAPLERERNNLLGRVTDRLRRELSKDELNQLLDSVDQALSMDPGHPPARQARELILDRLSDLEVAADLDAARIYLESGSWTRAVAVLDDLRARSRGDLSTLISLLLDWAKLLLDHEARTSTEIADAIALTFDAQWADAAQLLLTTGLQDERTRTLHLLLAERITAHAPDILLLRPPLYRLEVALTALASEDVPTAEPRALLAEISSIINRFPDDETVNLIQLRDSYRNVVDHMTALSLLLESLQSEYALPNRKLPLTALDRALNAAMALADNMHVIGKQATTSPRDATGALDHSRAIDPTNPTWDRIADLLNSLYELLGRYQTYIPAADGSDLEGWLQAAQRDLEPFVGRLFDEMLVGMVRGLGIAETAWTTFAASTLQGSRVGAITALAQATDAVGTVSPTLAGWLNQLRTVVTNASYVERHALFGGLGRALADGWEQYDRGKLGDAVRLGSQALEIARSEQERTAARRLRELAEVARDWVDRNGVMDVKRTQSALTTAELLYTPDEIGMRDNFSAQMPSKETYLRAMGKGLIELLARSSTAGVRILFFNYVLLGALDAQEDSLDDALFWRDAAAKTLGEYGPRHATLRALEDFIERRRDLKSAGDAINRINGPHALPAIEGTRKALEENPQSRLLAAGVYSLRELEAAARDWSDGEFRAAGIKLENAIKAIDEVEANAGVTLTGYRAWLMDLLSAAAELHAQSRRVASAVESRSEDSVEFLRSIHHAQVDTTEKMLGAGYAATLRQWRDSYESFLNVYNDGTLRRSAKLSRFNDLFRAMFIDRHPAYALYRHWYTMTEQSPEFPAPPTDEPTPQITEEDDAIAEAVLAASANGETPNVVSSTRPESSGRRFNPLLVVALLGIALVLALAVGATLLRPADDGSNATATAVAAALAAEASATAEAAAATEEVTEEPTPDQPPSPTSLPVLATVAPRDTSTPTQTFTPEPSATATETETYTPSPTATATSTPTATATATSTLPPQGMQGEQNLLTLLNSATELPWNLEAFSPAAENTYWRLGTGALMGEGVIQISPPPQWFEARYGNNAANRVLRADAELTLATYNPPLLIDNEVYFGLLMVRLDDPAASAGVEVQLVRDGIINVGQRSGDQVEIVSQRAVNSTTVRLRLERNFEARTLTLFINNEQVGAPMSFVGSDVPVLPAIYVKNGGVVVHVTRWTVGLR